MDDDALVQACLEGLVAVLEERGGWMSVWSAYQALHIAAEGHPYAGTGLHAVTRAETDVAQLVRRRLEAQFPDVSPTDLTAALHGAAALVLAESVGERGR